MKNGNRKNNMKKFIHLIAGARPNFIKIAPIWRNLSKESSFEVKIIHTGQHYDDSMSTVFFTQLGLPSPDFNLGIRSGSHAEQTSGVMIEYEKLVEQKKPDLTIVVGDVNSTLAVSIVCSKLLIPVAHVEAGLRSFDMSMPEEINRILTDRISNYLFVSEPSGIKNLECEGIDTEKVFFVGNVMIDSLLNSLPEIEKLQTHEKYEMGKNEYIVVTFHRPSNVDNKEKLLKLFRLFKGVSEKLPIIFPVHPRTKANIEKFELGSLFSSIGNLKMTDPLGYFEFISLVKNSNCVLTDSGGIQEETTFLGVSCFTFRENTERPVTLDSGINKLCSLDTEDYSYIFNTLSASSRRKHSAPELWDGRASERIAEIIKKAMCD